MMKKNSVLTEATFRRFMKLANMQPIGDGVIGEYDFDGAAEITEEEEEMEAGLDAPELEGPVEDEPALDEPALDEPALDEPAEEAGDLDVTLDAGQVDALIALGNQLEGGEEEVPVEEPALEPEEAPELAMEEGEDPTAETAETTDGETLEEEDTDTDTDALVAEVTRRVAQRLLSLTKK